MEEQSPLARERRAHELFLEALARPRDEREEFLRARAGEWPELHAEVRSLLASHEAASGFLEDPALPVGAGHPARIGPYRILRVLGEGGMGTVYLAEQKEPLRRRVALKVIKLGMDTRGVQARFERERQALAMMDHHAIARVFDAGTTESAQAYFAMEYVDGPPLTEYCEREGLSLPERLRLFLPVCRAVQHAHQKGILHRDLKPGNVLVAVEDGRPRPHVIDFGVARALHPREDERITRVEGVGFVGTPDYMSPEQAGVGGQDVDTRTDVYSLGVLLYEVVTGARPHEFGSGSSLGFAEIQRRLEESRPVRPSQRGRPVPPELEWIILKAIEGDRAQRYDTPNELADDLERFLRHDPVVAGPPSKAYVLRKFVRRNARMVVLGGIVFLALVAALGTSSVSLWQVRRMNREAERLLGDYRGLADDDALRELRREAADLWPAAPESVPRLQAWLGRARDLIDRLPYHRALLVRGAGEDAAGDEQEFIQDRRARLVRALEELRDDEERFDSVPAVRARLALIRRLERETLVEGAEAWARARAAIADPTRHPAYRGLELAPQFGLLPLGPDPRSGLWEFLVAGTGRAPTRGADGGLVAEEGAGIVLVLIPGGVAWIGLERESPPRAPDLESPRHGVELDPYFIGKYELSAGQWGRMHLLTAPSERLCPPRPEEPLLPATFVSWNEAVSVCRRLGLGLPTEAQWEGAARAGTRGRWCTGDDPRELARVANLFDQAAQGLRYAPERRAEPWNDGYAQLSPIGSFGPNAWGLHDVHGNVYEWCRDLVMAYEEVDPQPGTGLREDPRVRSVGRSLRGGSYATTSFAVRCSFRVGQQPERREQQIGLRVARRCGGER